MCVRARVCGRCVCACVRVVVWQGLCLNEHSTLELEPVNLSSLSTPPFPPVALQPAKQWLSLSPLRREAKFVTVGRVHFTHTHTQRNRRTHARSHTHTLIDKVTPDYTNHKESPCRSAFSQGIPRLPISTHCPISAYWVFGWEHKRLCMTLNGNFS